MIIKRPKITTYSKTRERERKRERERERERETDRQTDRQTDRRHRERTRTRIFNCTSAIGQYPNKKKRKAGGAYLHIDQLHASLLIITHSITHCQEIVFFSLQRAKQTSRRFGIDLQSLVQVLISRT